MIKIEQLDQFVVLFEHLFNSKFNRDEGYRDTRKIYTRDGFEVASIDILKPAPNEYDHCYDGYKTVSVIKSNGTKFGFKLNEELIEKIDLNECFFVVHYASNEKLIANAFYSQGPFTRISDEELNFMYNNFIL